MGMQLRPDKDWYGFEEDFERRPLHEAVISNDTRLVESILETDTKDINLKSASKSLLLIALENKNTRIAKTLIEHEINVNINAYEILVEVVRNEYTHLFELLAKKRIDAGRKIAQRTPKLSWYIENETQGRFKTALVEYLDSYEHPKEESLIEAARDGDAFRLKTLIRGGCNVNHQDENGNTPLLEAVMHKRTEAVKILMEAHADANVKSAQGASVLHMAIFDGKTELLEILQNYELDIDIKDNFGDTPLIKAITSKDTKVAEKLLDMGANTEARNANGLTPLKIATLSKNREMVETLILAKGKLSPEEKLWVEDWRKASL